MLWWLHNCTQADGTRQCRCRVVCCTLAEPPNGVPPHWSPPWNPYWSSLVKELHLCSDFSSIFSILIPQVRGNISLTFTGPCIANVFPKYNRQDATLQSIYFCKLLYMFQAVPPPIIRSSKLYIQHLVFLNYYCYLPLSWMIWKWFWCAVALPTAHSNQFHFIHNSGRYQMLYV
jgi:hypothetical protein